MNPYFTVNDSEHFTFYRIPKLLFTDEIYQTVSTDAKMLYGLLLDRLSLSEKNDWKDEHGRVYQYFTIHQAQELLHFGHEKVCRLFAELDAADLIERRRQGQGKANRMQETLPLIKIPPMHDPDAEIAGLTLTVPSWVSSIERARNNADMNAASTSAKSKLEEALLSLQKKVSEMLSEIREVD